MATSPIKSPDAALTVSMLPRGVAFAPTDIRLVVKLAPHAANRVLRFELDGAYYRSSEEMLEGAEAPIARTYWFRDVGGGQYVVRVTLGRVGERPLLWEEGLCVVGPGTEVCR